MQPHMDDLTIVVNELEVSRTLDAGEDPSALHYTITGHTGIPVDHLEHELKLAVAADGSFECLEFDSESSQFFAYTSSREDAYKLVALATAVTIATWRSAMTFIVKPAEYLGT